LRSISTPFNSCKIITKKQFAKKCDIRILSPASWIELKLNSKIDEKDINNLFDVDGQCFTIDEDRYSINIWTKKKLKMIETEILNFKNQIGKTSVFNKKILKINDGIIIVVFYRLNS